MKKILTFVLLSTISFAAEAKSIIPRQRFSQRIFYYPGFLGIFFPIGREYQGLCPGNRLAVLKDMEAAVGGEILKVGDLLYPAHDESEQPDLRISRYVITKINRNPGLGLLGYLCVDPIM